MRRRRRTSRRRRPTMMPGFGQAEEVVEETITETTTNGNGESMVPKLVAVGAVGFIGLGLLYGMSRASGSQAGRYGWGGAGR